MRYLFLISYLIIGCALQAQPISVGLYYGMGSSNISNHDVYTQNQLGYTTGIDLLYTLTPKINLASGVGYQHLQSKGTVNYYNQNGDNILSYNKQLYLHYINIPIGVSIHLFKFSRFNTYITGGVSYKFLVHANVNPQNYYLSHNVTKNYNNSDINLYGGIGANAKLNNQYSLYLSANYNQGMLNISKAENNKTTQLMLVQIGLLYNLKNENN